MTVRIGTSGWSYAQWRGVLYEPGLPTRKWLAHYATEFDTVELNGSFYRWPRADRFEAWRREVPDGFEFAVKAPRGLTHARRLNDPGVWIERITDGWDALDGKAGRLLVQLRPDHERDDGRLGEFLSALPERIPAVVEFRHGSWLDDAVFELLAKHRAAYCVMSGAQLPCILRATTDLVYVRMHGPDPDHLYAGSYSDADLHWWADRIREWQEQGRDVLVYFNNDGQGYAVRNAVRLKQFLS